MIKINLGRLLGRVAPALYSSPGVVIDELLQNSQRAGASELRVIYASSEFSGNGVEVIQIQDDGVGSRTPDPVLELAASGWEDADADPFGLGFWSAATVCSRVDVRSYDWEIHIDADRLRRTESVEGVVSIKTGLELVRGFSVRLFSPLEMEEWANAYRGPPAPTPRHFQLVRAWKSVARVVRSELDSVVKYMPFSDVLYKRIYLGVGGKDTSDPHVRALAQMKESLLSEPLGGYESIVTGKELLWNPTSLESFPVDADGVLGVLWPQPTAYWAADGAPHTGIRLLYDKRYVMTMPGPAGGVLEVSRGAATPRAPDRKDFVGDQSWIDLQKSVDGHIREMYREFLLRDELDIEAFDDSLLAVFSGADLVDLLPVDSADRGSLPEPSDRSDVPTFPDLPEAAAPGDVSVSGTTGDYAGRILHTPPASQEVKSGRCRGRVADLEGPIFWVGSQDAPQHEDLTDTLKAMGMQVIVASTRVLGKALVALGERRGDESVVHVPSMGKSLVQEVLVSPSSLEDCYTDILDPALEKLAMMFHVPRVEYGNIKSTTVLSIGDDIIRADAGTVLGACSGPTIYVQALYAKEVVSKALGAHSVAEKQVLSVALLLLTTVAHEKAHQMGPAEGHGTGHAELTESLIEAALGRLAEGL